MFSRSNESKNLTPTNRIPNIENFNKLGTAAGLHMTTGGIAIGTGTATEANSKLLRDLPNHWICSRSAIRNCLIFIIALDNESLLFCPGLEKQLFGDQLPGSRILDGGY